ncbi:lipoate--protein ligase family protein [Synechococcus sp. Cruz-9H2]|nr:lipoate--protein ligase family protein [Synechococcus sp. Cruz-9C9]MCP9818333.1 lipoate--protein ligase family protein [Synechococcus sp. Cruz-9H2]MCP9842168.1 lipoate--protein ligase family protein [Synechococcus sp. Edmonson 11F2]MCP9861576.1 lipoate--protein ligase family protein [Synechococcus sp. Cruz-7E5]MCP9869241.1 lipoate--protein ligase family protein [Synechococcus sp. Cruz-7B9]MCP9854729.1 lipoate--protein ligase family protein [Synechococcus sp. Cruz-9C9]
MAIDDWLLDQLPLKPGQGVVRLYTWSTPTLSLGHHQKAIDPAWRTATRQGRLALVRRPSGGGAVLHAGCLTYALLWPNPPRQRKQAYGLVAVWLAQALARLGLDLSPGQDETTAPASNCFASSTAADLVGIDRQKRVGSAQLWRKRQLLQHGSVLVDPPVALWQELFGSPLEAPATAPGLSEAALERELRLAAIRNLGGGPLLVEPLRPAEWAAVDRRRHRFRLS